MLTRAVETYLSVRRAAGFALTSQGSQLKSFAAFSEARKQHYVSTDIAIEWAGLARSVAQRARRLGMVIRLARYLCAEHERHEVPPAVFGAETLPRPTPYILTGEQIQQLVTATSRSKYRICRATYRALFSMLACTGLRVSEVIQLRSDDITPDGLVIRRTKFRKSRLVPLHETAQAGLERYLQRRRPYAPLDDHVFVSLRRKPLSRSDVERHSAGAVENERISTGKVVQRTVLYLGEINDHQQAAWRKTLSVFDEEHPGVFGSCWLACQLWQQLGMEEFWSLRLNGVREGIAWEKVLRSPVVNKLLDPGNEFLVHRQWYRTTAMDSLLERILRWPRKIACIAAWIVC
jgi:site-specific recombinase XerD